MRKTIVLATGLAALAALAFGLAGCAARAASLPAAAGPVQGHGFAIAPPAGNGWLVANADGNGIVFRQRPGLDQGADAPYVLTAGAQSLSDNALARRLAAAPTEAARDWLRRRLQAPRRDIVTLEVAPAGLRGARCAAYEAVQVEHDDPERILPDHVNDRKQYVQHGLLCAHPALPGRLVQVFYNEQFLRDAPPGVRVDAAQVRGFFAGLRWIE
jgi:hypothetical protein